MIQKLVALRLWVTAMSKYTSPYRGRESKELFAINTDSLYLQLHHHYLTMPKITFSFFILLLLTSCATSKFDFATAYKFQTVKKYSSLGEKSIKVLASPEQVFPNPLAMSESKIVETASIKSVTVASEDIIHSKLSTYEELDNMSRKDTRHNNKLNKIITRLGDIKFDTIITESGLVVPLIQKEELQEEQETQEASNKSKVAIASLFLLIGAVAMAAVAHISTAIPALVLFMSSIVCGIIGLNSEKERLASFVLQLGGGLLLILLIVLLITRDYGCSDRFYIVN